MLYPLALSQLLLLQLGDLLLGVLAYLSASFLLSLGLLLLNAEVHELVKGHLGLCQEFRVSWHQLLRYQVAFLLVLKGFAEILLEVECMRYCLVARDYLEVVLAEELEVPLQAGVEALDGVAVPACVAVHQT